MSWTAYCPKKNSDEIQFVLGGVLKYQGSQAWNPAATWYRREFEKHTFKEGLLLLCQCLNPIFDNIAEHSGEELKVRAQV